MSAEYLYRATAHDVRAIQGGGRYETSVRYERWRIEKETKCGLWLVYDPPPGSIGPMVEKRRVWRRWPTRWAQPSEEEALQALIERTRAWVKHEIRRHQRASQRLANLLAIAGPPKTQEPAPDSLGFSIGRVLERMAM